MSNTPQQQSGIRIPQYALTFTVLVFAVGALLLATSGIDSRAGIRAQYTQTPVPTLVPSPAPDPFVNLSYLPWKSPDSLVQLEYPKGWTPQANPRSGPLAYVIFPEGSTTQLPQITFFMVPTKQLGIPNVAPDASPDTILKTAFANPQAGQVVAPSRAVQAGDFKGSGVQITQSQQDTQSGATINTETDIWLFSLDPQNLVIWQATSIKDDWAKLEPVFQHVVGSLKIDTPNALVALNRAFNPTPQATGPATAAPTSAATTAPTAAPTSAATSAATAVPTMKPTTASTISPTAAATTATS